MTRRSTSRRGAAASILPPTWWTWPVTEGRPDDVDPSQFPVNVERYTDGPI